jgi:acyl-CoA thioesterase-1
MNFGKLGTHGDAMRRLGRVLAGLLMMLGAGAAHAAPITIVAVGASNTSGWGVGEGRAYPEQLQALLRARGVDAQVINAGRPFDTTAGMLGRIDSAVPGGTRIAILQPGGNDLRFLGTREQRSANIAAMARRLRARNILVIVFDPEIPRQYYAWDGIHLTVEGHAWIAASLLPQVMAVLRPTAKPRERAQGEPKGR